MLVGAAAVAAGISTDQMGSLSLIVSGLAAAMMLVAGIWFLHFDRSKVGLDRWGTCGWKRTIWAILFGCSASAVCNMVIQLSGLSRLFPAYEEIRENMMSDQPIWLLLLITALIAPFAEECIFRGLIFSRLREDMKSWTAIMLSALIFGVFHGNVVQAVYASMLGVLLALVYEKTGSLWAAIWMHMGGNFYSAMMSTLNSCTLNPWRKAVQIAIIIAFCILFVESVFRLVKSPDPNSSFMG